LPIQCPEDRKERKEAVTTKLDEIAPDIYRLSTHVRDIGPTGLTFNQFLVVDEEPLLFHTGHRSMFPSVREALERVIPIERLRWIAFGHVESDECGAMNELLAVAPRAEVAHGALGCTVSIAEMASRPPRALADGEVLATGAKRFRHIDTPHVPHAWEARVLFEETTGTLFCGDLFTHTGDGPAVTEHDIVDPARETEDMFGYSSLAPATPATVERLADLAPRSLALMHGSSFAGDCRAALNGLAADYRRRLEGWTRA
jgi:flavorubredoxin